MKFRAATLYRAFRDVEVIASVVARDDEGNRLFEVRRITLGEGIDLDVGEEIINEKYFERIEIIS